MKTDVHAPTRSIRRNTAPACLAILLLLLPFGPGGCGGSSTDAEADTDAAPEARPSEPAGSLLSARADSRGSDQTPDGGDGEPPDHGPMLDPDRAGTSMRRGGPPRTGADQTETFGVELARGGVGVVRRGDRVQLADDLPVASDQGVVVMHAADAEDVTARPGIDRDLLGESRVASSGRYVGDPNFMALPFRIEETGRYDIYVRVRQGESERNNFFWTISSGRSWFVLDEDADETPENWWHWLKIDNRRITADDHRFLYQYRHRAAWDFDAVAIVPEGLGEPDGRVDRIRTVTPDRGRVESRDVTPPAMQRLIRVEATDDEHDAGRGELRYEVSLDGGRSWQEAPDGDLRHINIAGDGSDTLRVRVHLERDAQGRSPRFDGLRLTVEPDPDSWRVIRNDFARIVLDGETGRLFRLTDLKHDRELVWAEEAESLFSIELKEPGTRQWRRYNDRDVRRVTYDPDDNAESDRADRNAKPARFESVTEHEDRLTARYRVENDVAVDLTIAMDETSQTIWTADVANNHADLDVIRLEFPRLPRVRLGPDGSHDRQLRPQVRGYQSWRPGLEPMRDNVYPGGIVMPWQSVFDETGGLGMIARDPKWRNVEFLTDADEHFGATFTASMRLRDNIPAGGGRDRWQAAVAVHPDQWHWVADRYREFAIDHFDRPDYPDWVAESDGFSTLPMQVAGISYTEMKQAGYEARELGLDHVQVWGQFTGPDGGCCATYWQPSPAYGTLEEFKQGVADVQDLGVRIGFFFLHDRIDLYNAEGSHIHGMNAKADYPSGTEFPTSEFFDRVQIVNDRAGERRAYPLSESDWDEYERRLERYLGGSGNPPRRRHFVDLADEQWWEYMRRWAIDYYVEQWNADAHYYDVLGTGSARESWDRRKGHHGHAISGPGKDGIARTTVDSARERGHEEYYLLMEGMADIPGQHAAAMISGLYQGHSETVRYTWPDMIMYEGHSNVGHNTPIESLTYAFLNGNRFDITIQNSNIIAHIIDARARVRDWIYRGRFMDTIGLNSPVDARVFHRVDDAARGAAVTFVNPDGRTGSVSLDDRYAPEATHGVAVDNAGQVYAVEIDRRDGRLHFDVPTGHLTTVVFADHVDPEYAVVAGGRLIRQRGETFMELKLANLTDETLPGRVRPEESGPFDLNEQTGAIEPRSVATVRYEVGEPPDFTTPQYLEFTWAMDDSEHRFTAPAFPGARDGDFALTGNTRDEAFRGEQSYHFGPSDGTQLQQFPLYLEPGRRYRISVAYKRTDGSARINNARVYQRLDPRDEVRQARIDFPVANRWARSDVVFNSHEEASYTTLYVYNTDSERHCWIDDIRVEDLGPAPQRD